MEKIMYPLWKAHAQSDAQFRQQLLGPMTERLVAEGVLKMRISVVDEDVDVAAPYRIEATKPAINGLLSLWVNSSNYRQPLEQIVADYVARYEGYLVTESEPIPNTTHQYQSQMCLLPQLMQEA